MVIEHVILISLYYFQASIQDLYERVCAIKGIEQGKVVLFWLLWGYHFSSSLIKHEIKFFLLSCWSLLI